MILFTKGTPFWTLLELFNNRNILAQCYKHVYLTSLLLSSDIVRRKHRFADTKDSQVEKDDYGRTFPCVIKISKTGNRVKLESSDPLLTPDRLASVECFLEFGSM